MTLHVNSEMTFSREPTSAAQKWALDGINPSVFALAYEGLGSGNEKQSAIVALASNAIYWRLTGMESLCLKIGVTRQDMLKNPVRAMNEILKWVQDPKSSALSIEAVLQLLHERDLGLAGVPPQDTRTNGTTIIRDLVNPRTKEYRTYFPLPGLHWGTCQCCSGNSHLTFIKRLGTLKGLEAGQTKTILQDVFSNNDKLDYPTLLAEIFSNTNDDELGALLHIVDGNGNLQLMRYCISPRYSEDRKKSWQVQAYCLECMRNFEDPASALRMAYTFKQLSKIRHEMMVSGRDFKQVSDAYRVSLKKSQLELEAASAHLKMTERVIDLNDHGRTIQQRSSNFTVKDEDALARDAFTAGLKNEVIQGRKKSDLWRIKAERHGKGQRPTQDSITRLRTLIEAKSAISELAAADTDVKALWGNIVEEE